MTAKINTKLTEEYQRTTSTPPNYIKGNAKLIGRAVPVSESKREACKAVQQGLMAQINERIEAEKKTSESRIKRDELAAKPFKELKEKLSNPRIKSRGKARGTL